MSVSLVIEKVEGIEKNKYIPVSGQKFFVDFWMPLCELYDLKWVPLFETGFTFTEKDLPVILNELLTLRKHKLEEDNEYFQDRLDLLIDSLEKLRGKDVSFFIG